MTTDANGIVTISDPPENGAREVHVSLDATALDGLKQGQKIELTLDDVNARRIGISKVTIERQSAP